MSQTIREQLRTWREELASGRGQSRRDAWESVLRGDLRDLRDLPLYASVEVFALLVEYIGPLADSMNDPSLDRPMPIATPEPNVSWAKLASGYRKLLHGHRIEALRDARTHGPRAFLAWATMEAFTVSIRWRALRERFGGDDRD